MPSTSSRARLLKVNLHHTVSLARPHRRFISGANFHQLKCAGLLFWIFISVCYIHVTRIVGALPFKRVATERSTPAATRKRARGWSCYIISHLSQALKCSQKLLFSRIELVSTESRYHETMQKSHKTPGPCNAMRSMRNTQASNK